MGNKHLESSNIINQKNKHYEQLKCDSLQNFTEEDKFNCVSMMGKIKFKFVFIFLNRKKKKKN